MAGTPARVHSRQPRMVTISFQKDHHDMSQDLIENKPAWSSSKWKDVWLKFLKNKVIIPRH